MNNETDTVCRWCTGAIFSVPNTSHLANARHVRTYQCDGCGERWAFRKVRRPLRQEFKGRILCRR